MRRKAQLVVLNQRIGPFLISPQQQLLVDVSKGNKANDQILRPTLLLKDCC